MAATRIGVVGAGIIGLAIARRLLQVDPEIELTILEKEGQVAQHQTGHNSGVVHAGVYYTPGSLKATLCRKGMGMTREYCEQNSITYDECGKLIVARNSSELGRLADLEDRATRNGVPGIRRVDRSQIIEIEPHAAGIEGVYSPKTAICDYPAMARRLADEISEQSGTLRLNFEVALIRRRGGEIRVTSRLGEGLIFDRLFVCGGLQSDRLAAMAGEDPEPAIVPFRGEYYKLVPSRTSLVNGLIYPVPDPNYPFLGVHFTKRVDGGVDVGPNAVLAFAREGYRRTDFSASDLLEVIRNPGFRKLAVQNWRMGLGEMKGSFSKRAFLKGAKEYVPELQADDMVPAHAGIRAQALDRDGSLVDDFRITNIDGLVLVRNAPSPAATSSLAIAEHVIAEVYAPA